MVSRGRCRLRRAGTWPVGNLVPPFKGGPTERSEVEGGWHMPPSPGYAGYSPRFAGGEGLSRFDLGPFRLLVLVEGDQEDDK